MTNITTNTQYVALYLLLTNKPSTRHAISIAQTAFIDNYTQ
jgi:hypothetical protein